MKCWKCGNGLPNGASICPYCSASMIRKAPVTTIGKAMRQIYDKFGCDQVFAKKSILPAALGDLLEDTKVLRSQFSTALAAGIGSIYINQLLNVGRPSTVFYAKVKALIVEEAGLSEKVASELMGYFDEMIGWMHSVSPASPPSPDHGSGADTITPPPHHGTGAGTITPPPHHGTGAGTITPPPHHGTGAGTITPPPSNDESIPLPTAAVPVKDTGCFNLLLHILVLGATGAVIYGGIMALTSGLWFGVILAVFGFFICRGILDELDKVPGERKLIFSNTGTAIELTWKDPINRFAVAVGDKWVLTGTGNRVALTGNLFAHYKPGEKFKVTLAEITATKVEFRGEIRLQRPQQQ